MKYINISQSQGGAILIRVRSHFCCFIFSRAFVAAFRFNLPVSVLFNLSPSLMLLFTSNGYNFTIGLVTLPVAVLKVTDRINPSFDSLSEITLPSFHCIRGFISSSIKTMSPSLTCMFCVPLDDFRSRKPRRYSFFHFSNKFSLIVSYFSCFLTISSLVILPFSSQWYFPILF